MARFYLYTWAMLQILFPALFQTEAYLDLLSEARLPMLGRLLARGRREQLEQSSLEDLLCKELQIVCQPDPPIAAISLSQAGGQPGTDYWLRADPVHVRIERDRVILNELAAISADEAMRLCEALSAHFGEAFSPHPLRPEAWVVRAGGEADLVTTPMSRAAGQPIEPLLPSSRDAMPWRRLLNEAQMLLFHHPVNEAREARGEPAINSVWLWGGGRLPAKMQKQNRAVFTRSPDWRALADHAGAEVHTLPENWHPDMAEPALVVFDEPHRQLRQGDFYGWLTLMRAFESRWLTPLLASGRTFRIDDPLQRTSLHWRRAYGWKFWLRPAKPVRQSFSLQPPAADAGIDAFGNRY